ncbi:MAG: RNA methyltransferase [Crocinitomicaceae bacterium]|nr:RNA methyltransferase [Crocinitomicaceae bacterium]MBT6515278.1 RNA methyltransferase [Crocinitomicaceae bacterium]
MRTDLFEYMFEFLTEERKERFISVVNNRTRHVTVVLEDLFQMHNASAVLRSCDCFGIQDAHIIENRNEYKLNKEIDMGSTKWLHVNKYSEKENNTIDCINHLKSQGYTIYATTPQANNTAINKIPLKNKIALLFGTELTGLSETALKHADGLAHIPMYGFTESFNISVSAALVLSELSARLRTENISFELTSEEKTALLFEWTMKTVKSSHKIKNRYLIENPI